MTCRKDFFGKKSPKVGITNPLTNPPTSQKKIEKIIKSLISNFSFWSYFHKHLFIYPCNCFLWRFQLLIHFLEILFLVSFLFLFFLSNHSYEHFTHILFDILVALFIYLFIFLFWMKVLVATYMITKYLKAKRKIIKTQIFHHTKIQFSKNPLKITKILQDIIITL